MVGEYEADHVTHKCWRCHAKKRKFSALLDSANVSIIAMRYKEQFLYTRPGSVGKPTSPSRPPTSLWFLLICSVLYLSSIRGLVTHGRIFFRLSLSSGS